MQLKDILSKEEIKEYHKQWKSFSPKYKYKPEMPYKAHSGRSVIGKVFSV